MKSTNYTCQNLRLIFGQCQNLRAHVGDLDVPGVLQDPKDTWMLLGNVFPLDRNSLITRSTQRYRAGTIQPSRDPTEETNRGTIFTVNISSFFSFFAYFLSFLSCRRREVRLGLLGDY